MPRKYTIPSNTLPLPNDVGDLLRRLAEAGLTEAEIAPFFGISTTAFRDVLQRNPELYEILMKAKEVPNQKVEAALYKRALGYQTREVTKTAGRETKVVIKEFAPDVVADIFWLKNRDPKRWRDTIDMQFTLRDRLNRAHEALRGGHTPMIENKGGNGGGDE
jgi:hypothetical protein